MKFQYNGDKNKNLKSARMKIKTGHVQRTMDQNGKGCLNNKLEGRKAISGISTISMFAIDISAAINHFCLKHFSLLTNWPEGNFTIKDKIMKNKIGTLKRT